MTDRLKKNTPKIWERIKKKYISVGNITGVTQDQIRAQIAAEMLRVNQQSSSRGDFGRMVDAGFPKIAEQNPEIKKEILAQNLRYIEYERRGKKEYAVIQKKGDKTDEHRRPTLFLTRTTAAVAEREKKDPFAILQERLGKRGVDFNIPAQPEIVKRKPIKTRYPKKRDRF